jgi:WD40 repeat protein
MLVVVTDEGTVSVLDEYASGLGGVGLKERRKFRVMINCGRRTMGIDGRVVPVGLPEWYSIGVSFPIAVVSVNGAVLAIKDSTNCFSTWDITTGLFVRRFVGHDDSSAPSEENISCKCMPHCHAWPQDECPAVGHRSEITAMAISHRGDRIASADAAGIILMWDAETAAVLYEVTGYNPCEPMAIAFSPNGLNFVVTDTEGFICEHEVGDGLHIHTPFYPSNTAWSRCETRAVVWTPDSTRYACGYARGQVKTIDSDGYLGANNLCGDTTLPGGLYLKRSEDAVNALAISPDGKSVAVAGERVIAGFGNGTRVCGFVAVYNSTDNTLRWKEFATPGHDGGVISLSFSLDGKQLVSAGVDKYVRLWDPRDGSRLKGFQQYDLPIPRRHPPEFYPPELPNQIALPAGIVCTTFCTDVEGSQLRQLAFAQGHQERIGASSIVAVLSPDLMRKIGLMM